MSLFTKSWTLARQAARRAMSTGIPVQDAAASAAASSSSKATLALAGAVGTTFVTYMTADFLSNFLQHPTQMMDYGFINQYLGRPVDRNFWGTRTEHIVGVAAALAVTDHTSQHLFSRFWLQGKPLAFSTAPAAFVAHTFFFIFSGVTLYVAADAALNPDLEGRRLQALSEGTYSSAIGSCTAWYEPYVAPTLARVAGPAVAGTWFGSALLPATLAYTTVKGVGWNDWGNSGLNDLERRMNGLADQASK